MVAGATVVVVGSAVVVFTEVADVVTVDVVVADVVGVVVVADVVGVVVGSIVVVVGSYWRQSSSLPSIPIVFSASFVLAPRIHFIFTVLQPHAPIHTIPH